MSDEVPEESAGRSIAELTAGMLAKDLWVIHSTPVDESAADAIVQLLPQHLAHMIQLESDGVLFASGPFLDDDGEPTFEGMTVVRAADREAATAMAVADPLVVAGLRSVTVRPWRIMEGGMRLSVGFATGRFEVE